MTEKQGDPDPPQVPWPEIGSEQDRLRAPGSGQGNQDPRDAPGAGRSPRASSRRLAAAPTSEEDTGAGRSPGRARGPRAGVGPVRGVCGAWETRERRYCYTVTSLINMLLTLSLSFSGS